MTTVVEPARFSFRFADLAPVLPEPALRILTAPDAVAPGGTEEVAAQPRPSWLPRLLPVFAAREPMRVDVLGAAAPPFAARLRAALAALCATAGAEAGIRVATWDGGLSVGAHGEAGVPVEAHAVVVVAALERGSVAAAAEIARNAGAERAWVVLDGDVPRADAALGVSALASLVKPGRLVRLPLLGRRELAVLADGRDPSLARRPVGLRHLALAAGLVRAYLEQQA